MSKNLSIPEIRAALEWDRQTLALKVGVDVSTVSRWETGKANPSGAAKATLERLGRRAAIRLASQMQPEMAAAS